MRTCFAIVLWLVCSAGLCQTLPVGRTQNAGAYPEPEAAAAWRSVAAGYVRKAMKDRKLNTDPALNARVDAVVAGVGAALAAVDPRFSGAVWNVILIEEFGHGAAAFPGETILADAKFIRSLNLTDDELALVFSHEMAHVVAGHAYEKLSFMAETLGRDKAPTARTALLEFFASDSYAEALQPVARLQEREADRIGAAILFASAYDARRALTLFDKLAAVEERGAREAMGTHDAAMTRKQCVSAVLADLLNAAARRNPRLR